MRHLDAFPRFLLKLPFIVRLSVAILSVAFFLLHRCYTRACGYWVACELAARLIGYSRCCTAAKCPRARTAATAESGERSVHPECQPRVTHTADSNLWLHRASLRVQ